MVVSKTSSGIDRPVKAMNIWQRSKNIVLQRLLIVG
jgi:hypothetical protein